MSFLDNTAVTPGAIIHMRNWEHVTPTLKLRYGVGRSSRDVAVFIYLGSQPLNKAEPFDFEKRMNELGWFRK